MAMVSSTQRTLLKRFPRFKSNVLQYLLLMSFWLAAYKSATLFAFLESYASLWFLPAGVTLAITATVPMRLITAPLLANLILAVPLVCKLLNIPFTNATDPIIHAFRLFVIYGGAGLFLRFAIGDRPFFVRLQDATIVVAITLMTAILGAVSGVSLHVLAGNFTIAVGQEIFVSWFVGDAIGALIVPPLLAPLLSWWFSGQKSAGFLPSKHTLLSQLVLIPLVMYCVFAFPLTVPYLGGFWYLILFPPVVFAVLGGVSAAASATILTTFLSPVAAYFSGFGGEAVELQFLLMFSAVVSLVLGASITDQRLAFQDLKDSEVQLELQVHERTNELLEAYKFQQHLIRSIGHDLRQPVQSMNIMLDGMARLLVGNPASLHVENAKKVGQNASDFIARVLDYAKRDAGQVELVTQNIELDHVFQNLRDTFLPEANACNIELDFSGGEHRIQTDELLLWEALSNLVQNALRLSSAGQSVAVYAQRQDGWLEVGVKDSVDTSYSFAGEAGFGTMIVSQLADLLGAKFISEPNCYHLKFVDDLSISTKP